MTWGVFVLIHYCESYASVGGRVICCVLVFHYFESFVGLLETTIFLDKNMSTLSLLLAKPGCLSLILIFFMIGFPNAVDYCLRLPI